MLENIELFTQSSIKFTKDKIIYFDPFKIEEEYHDANIVFITHNHYDHFSLEDIKKVVNENSLIVIPKSFEHELPKEYKRFIVEPNNTYEIENIKVETIPSYNRSVSFHTKESNWVGYIITIDNIRYYIAGDTDITEENKQVICDVAFLPIGGQFTMNPSLAAELSNTIKPKIVVPTHYGSIVGKKEYAIEFRNKIDKDIKCIILMK